MCVFVCVCVCVCMCAVHPYKAGSGWSHMYFLTVFILLNFVKGTTCKIKSKNVSRKYGISWSIKWQCFNWQKIVLGCYFKSLLQYMLLQHFGYKNPAQLDFGEFSSNINKSMGRFCLELMGNRAQSASFLNSRSACCVK